MSTEKAAGKTAEKRRRAVRADARENHTSILAAAYRRFAQEGSNATMEGIAQEAGVAVGTLYHHFGTKEGLLAAVVEEGLAQVAVQLQQLLEEPDPWQGVVRLVHFLAEKQWSDQAFTELIRRDTALRANTTALKRQLGPVIQAILDRAKTSGQIRADLVATDIPLLLAGIGSQLAADVRERYLAIVLNGLRA